MLPGANLKFVSDDFNVYSLIKSVEKVSYHEFPKSQFFTYYSGAGNQHSEFYCAAFSSRESVRT